MKGKKVLVHVQKKLFYKLSNHTASGHQLESCTFKGFDPYIYAYKVSKYPQSIHIHINAPPRPKVQVVHTSKVPFTVWFEEIKKMLKSPPWD